MLLTPLKENDLSPTRKEVLSLLHLKSSPVVLKTSFHDQIQLETTKESVEKKGPFFSMYSEQIMQEIQNDLQNDTEIQLQANSLHIKALKRFLCHPHDLAPTVSSALAVARKVLKVPFTMTLSIPPSYKGMVSLESALEGVKGVRVYDNLIKGVYLHSTVDFLHIIHVLDEYSKATARLTIGRDQGRPLSPSTVPVSMDFTIESQIPQQLPSLVRRRSLLNVTPPLSGSKQKSLSSAFLSARSLLDGTSGNRKEKNLVKRKSNDDFIELDLSHDSFIIGLTDAENLLLQGLLELDVDKICAGLECIDSSRGKDDVQKMISVGKAVKGFTQLQMDQLRLSEGLIQGNVMMVQKALENDQMIIERYTSIEEGKEMIRNSESLLEEYSCHIEQLKRGYNGFFSLSQYPHLRSQTSWARWGVFVRHSMIPGMLKWSKHPLPNSLIDFKSAGVRGKELRYAKELAVKVFEEILIYQRYRKSDAPWESACKIVFLGKQCDALVEEIFLQLIKQTTATPERESLILGLKLLFICLKAFRPSKIVSNYLLDHLESLSALNVHVFSSFDSTEDLAARCFELVQEPSDQLIESLHSQLSFQFYHLRSTAIDIRIGFPVPQKEVYHHAAEKPEAKVNEQVTLRLYLTEPSDVLQESLLFGTEFRQGSVGECCGMLGKRLGIKFVPRLKLSNLPRGYKRSQGVLLDFDETLGKVHSKMNSLRSKFHHWDGVTYILLPHQKQLESASVFLDRLAERVYMIRGESVKLKKLTVNQSAPEHYYIPPPPPSDCIPPPPEESSELSHGSQNSHELLSPVSRRNKGKQVITDLRKKMDQAKDKEKTANALKTKALEMRKRIANQKEKGLGKYKSTF